MNDPMKIIFKFKNNNRRVQYHTYIYIGPVISSIMTILNKIKSLSLYDTLLELTENEYSKLEKYYGDKWYTFFFNTYHLNYLIYHINNNKQQQKELVSKYGNEWYNKHFKQFLTIEKKIFYSYAANIKTTRMLKEQRKYKKKIEEEENIDYLTLKQETVDSTYKDPHNSRLVGDTKYNEKNAGFLNAIHSFHSNTSINKQNKNDISTSSSDSSSFDDSSDSSFDDSSDYMQVGGAEDEDNNNDDYDDDIDEPINDGPINEPINELLEDESDDIENIYQDMDANIDKDAMSTLKLIKDALKDDALFKKNNTDLADFDTSKDTNMYDEQLKNVFYKHYITTQYIFKDDTVKMIKNKICCSILNNKKFGKNPYITPSRQHLWSEYYYDNKIEKVMIGQKWIKKSDLLNIDVEPNNNFAIYEELRGKLKLLRDNIKRYGSKIKREDDDFNIVHDYDDYYTNNEIFMCDVYNELGTNYEPDNESLKNIMDVYFKIYFPRIKQDDIKYIIDYLKNNTVVEENKIVSVFDTLHNDLILENQIMFDVEKVKETSVYRTIFKENYITQSVIHVNLRTINTQKIDLFRIFNEFTTNEEYPFVQYQTMDGQIIYKFDEKIMGEYSSSKDNADILLKWFENAPYGISFKVKIKEMGSYKFMAINLNETGRIEYKTQWKEDDLATINDIINTYNYVKKLIEKINKEKNKVQFELPHNEEFKYAFINTIQKFQLPDKYFINHNDLSEFARYFFPYIALVIEPRKRQSKIKKDNEKSKFGTYLRYKRVSKYENQARIEQRILYFMKNYDYNDKSLANEISKQFNITIERSVEEIDRVREKYPNIKRSRKILKRLENIPKYKPPGIGIDIQGKPREKYKIRISGARNKLQLDRIINFMNILMFLYIETYLYKKPERQSLKEKLKKLTNIAKRRNKVDELVDYEKDEITIKQMAKSDKKRIGFKPAKGQNQWTRLCQHSGKEKKRRPQQYLSVDDVVKNGYSLNEKTGLYEKNVTYKTKNGKSKTILIRAVGLKGTSESGELDSTIFYSCNPIDNGEHMYVGFLARSTNPFGSCMPCCFKKDHYISDNTSKQEYYKNCVTNNQKKSDDTQKIIGDILYILQDTNKIQEGRFSFLQKYLDFFFNTFFNKSVKIKHHYLLSAQNGYFFKYGSRQEDNQFLYALSSLLDKSASNIKSKILECLEGDTKDLIFTALNNGDTKTQFQTKEKFIEFTKTNNNMDFEMYADLFSLPGVIRKNGLNIIIFNKYVISIKKTLEKEKLVDDFSIICQNPENLEDLFERDTIFMVKENLNYFPIVLVFKKDDTSKDITMQKIFKYDQNSENIVSHVKDLYIRNCQENIIYDVSNNSRSMTAKNIHKILLQLNNKDFLPKYQVIDTRNKCKYMICNNGTIIPVKPSGTIYDLPILTEIGNKMLSIKESIEKINLLSDKLKSTKDSLHLPIKPIGFYYDTKDKTKAAIVAIMTETKDIIPVKEETMNIDVVKKMKFLLEHKQLFDKIDEDIMLTTKKKIKSIDDRITKVNYMEYIDESYELFRLEFSEYINGADNEKTKKQIMDLIKNNKIDSNHKKNIVKSFLFNLIDPSLGDIFVELTKFNTNDENIIKGKHKFAVIEQDIPDLSNYQISNNRNSCTINQKDDCTTNAHCKWSNNSCKFRISKEIAIMAVNKISEELINDELKAGELLQLGEYYVSDIVDYNRFTERKGQKIIKSTNMTLDKRLEDIFGKNSIPVIGKRRIQKFGEINIHQMSADHPIKNMGNFYVQQIIDNNLTIYRAFINGYFWIKQQYYDIETRNIGYYNDMQTHLANYIRSLVIDFAVDKKNKETMTDLLDKYYDGSKKNDANNFINKISRDIVTSTNCIIELHILNNIYKIPIMVYNNNNDIIYIFDKELVFNYKNDNIDNKKFAKYKDNIFGENIIHIKFVVVNSLDHPINIETIYNA